MSVVSAKTEDFKLLAGAELINSCEAPLLEYPPAYKVSFCSRCGSPLPDFPLTADRFEIPAGLLEDNPGIIPDKHIFVVCKSTWYDIADSLPQLSKAQLIKLRLSSKSNTD